MTLLLKGGYIIPCNDDSEKCIKDGYIAVENDKIIYVGKDKPQGDFDSFIDKSDCILMPALINTHTHSPMVLLRGVGSDLPLDKWLFGKIVPIEDRLTQEDIQFGSYLACMEMLAGGTVSFSDMYFEPQVTAQAVLNVGMKANLCRPVQSFDPNEAPKDSFRIAQAIELYNSFNRAGNGSVLVDFCIHAEYTCTDKITEALVNECNKRNGNLHIHLSETEKEHLECIERHKKSPAKWFADLGAFNSNAFAAHCVTLTDEDIEILKTHGVSVAHNPTSNMKLGSGFADIPKYLQRELNVTLGTDGAASNNNLDMFEEMHLAGIIHKGFKREATLLPAYDVLKMATSNGAKLQGRADCGELKKDNKADIIAVSLNAPHMMPCLDPIALLVYSAQSSDVNMTMCNGKVLYEKGEFKTIDTEKVMHGVKKSINRLYGE